MTEWQEITGGVTAPKGYRASGVSVGFKSSGMPDLALILSDVEAIAAGVFTTNQMRSVSVDYCRQCLRVRHSARAILCNSGQANTGTGKQGTLDAYESAQLLAKELGIDIELILLASTGVIGQRINMEAMRSGINYLVAELSRDGSDAASQAIITTDLVTKSIALEMMIDDRPIRMGGIAKGSGMIHPNMATMLAFVTTDAAISPHLWQEMLSRAANRSFNSITIDGDTSPNDCLIGLANGQSRTHAITEKGKGADKLEEMLTAVCQHLAKAIARDGEGATCLIEVQVTGAVNEKSACQVAKTIVGSSLVKSAIFGRDPNWGRIAAAAGRAGVQFDQDLLRIQLGDFLIMENGQPLPFDRMAAIAYLEQASQGTYLQGDIVLIQVSIGHGYGKSVAWGGDLSYDYIKINAKYTT